MLKSKRRLTARLGASRPPKDRFVKEGETVTTLTDPSTMWVYFNVPEAQYLEYARPLEAEQR